MKINAEIIHSKDNINKWDTLAANLIKLDHGTQKHMDGPELLPGLGAKLKELRDKPIENELRFIELVRWLVQQAETTASTDTAAARAAAKQHTDEAKRLLGCLKTRQLLGGALTKEEWSQFKDFPTELVTPEALQTFANLLHNHDKQKKTVGELSEAVFSWREVVNGNQQEEKLFIDSLALLALRNRAEQDTNKAKNDMSKVNRHLQVNWFLIAAQAALFIGDKESAQAAITELNKYADEKKKNKAYWRVQVLDRAFNDLNSKSGNDSIRLLTPAETKMLALENSKGTYYKRAHGDPRRPGAGVYIFFTCLAILALVFGVGVFVASHGGAALLFAPAGHALLSLLGVTTKVAADALAFSLLSLIPLSIFAISMEAAFPRGGLGRFFSFLFKNKAANRKIQDLSPFHLTAKDADLDKKPGHEPKQVTLWAALKKRPIVTPLKFLLYPITYPVGVVLAIVSPEDNKAAASGPSTVNEQQRLLADDHDKGKEAVEIETSEDWDKFFSLMHKSAKEDSLLKRIQDAYQAAATKLQFSRLSETQRFFEIDLAVKKQTSGQHKVEIAGPSITFFGPGKRAREALTYLKLQRQIQEGPKPKSSSSSSSSSSAHP